MSADPFAPDIPAPLLPRPTSSWERNAALAHTARHSVDRAELTRFADMLGLAPELEIARRAAS